MAEPNDGTTQVRFAQSGQNQNLPAGDNNNQGHQHQHCHQVHHRGHPGASAGGQPWASALGQQFAQSGQNRGQPLASAVGQFCHATSDNHQASHQSGQNRCQPVVGGRVQVANPGRVQASLHQVSNLPTK